MRVIEQLVQHFWARGSISRDEARYLVRHGFVREGQLAGFGEEDTKEHPPLRDGGPARRGDEAERAALEAEDLESELVGRTGGKKAGGRKKKPTGHNLAPAAAVLAGHFAAREPYPALLELAEGIRPRPGWQDAARVVAAADPGDLEVALVGLLNARPRALGELWFWFDLEPLYAWAEDKANAGPVAAGLAKLMRVSNRNQVGRAGQLMKAAEVRALADLLDARRAFLGVLPRLYAGHFASLGRWLVPPTGAAAGCWPSLPWAFVIAYNAREGTADAPPPGYQVNAHGLPFVALRDALATAYPLAPAAVRDLLIYRLREQDVPAVNVYDWRCSAVFDRPLYCPLNWRV